MKIYSEFVLTKVTESYWFASVTETKKSLFKKESKRIKIFKEKFSIYWRNVDTGEPYDFSCNIYALEMAYRAKEELENNNG